MGDSLRRPTPTIKTPTTKTIHEVEKTGNLYFLLNGFNGAINKLASEIGSGLRAIALALSTPIDNSTEVQKQIDKIRADLKQEADAFEESAKQQ